METSLVVCEIDSQDPLLEELAAGAIPIERLFPTWQALEHIKVVARVLPPYAAGIDPKRGLFAHPPLLMPSMT